MTAVPPPQRTRATPQQPRLAALALLFLLWGLLAGRLEVLVLAAPFLAVLVLAALRPAPQLTATVRLGNDRCLEGEPVEVGVVLASTAPVDVAVVGVRLDRGLAVDGARRLAVPVPRARPTGLGLAVRAATWGAYDVGPVLVTAYSRWRLAATTVTLDAQPLRVLPHAPDFAAGDAVPSHRALTGSHVSSAAGDGLELAAVRAYRPGDPLRRVNWRVSARRPSPDGGLHVTDLRPERSTDLVLVVDTFAAVGPPGQTSLDVAVRAAAAVAEHYLARMDRVGVIGFGGVLRWLQAGSGRNQLHAVTDHLLGSRVIGSYAWKDITLLPAALLPPRALVVALSPLLDERAAGAVADLARRGHDVVVLDTAPAQVFPPPSDPQGRLARRLFALERQALLDRLAQIGVAVVPWQGSGSLDAALLAVSRRRRAATRR